MNSLQVSSLTIVWLFLFLSFLFIFARLLTRTFLKKTRGLDDTIIVIAWVINLCTSIAYTITVTKGTGVHTWLLTEAQKREALKSEAFVNGILVHAFSWPKLSIGILLIRVFQPQGLMKWHLIALPVICILCSCILTIMQYVQCNPVEGNWDMHIEAKCWPRSIYKDFALFTGSYSAALDLYFALFPLPFIWSRITDKKKRIMLSIVMSLGVIACAVSIVKTVMISKRDDITYNRAWLDLWNQVEANIVMIAATIPTLLPLFREFAARWRGTRARHSHSVSFPSNQYDSQLPKGRQGLSFGPAGGGAGGIELVLYSKPSIDADVEAGKVIGRMQDIFVEEETGQSSSSTSDSDYESHDRRPSVNTVGLPPLPRPPEYR